jgi:hypothetical protein
MKKSILKITVISLLTVSSGLLTTSCKKYDEGPAISLRSKKARVVNKWKAEKVMENGKDVTSDYQGVTWEFKDDNKLYFNFPGGLAITGKWEFNNDKSKIIVTLDITNEKSELEILRLKEKSMWLKEKDKDDNGNPVTTEFHLIPA